MNPLIASFFRLFLLILCVLFGSTVANGQVEQGKAFFQQATQAYSKRQFASATALALTADSLFQIQGNAADKLPVKSLLAKIYVARREPLQVVQFSEAAINLLEAAGQQDSLLEADIQNTYGSGLLETRQFEKSETAYRRAIEIKKNVLGPKTAEIGIQLSNLGNVYFKKGALSEAMRYGKAGIEMREGGISPNPNLLAAYTNLGIFHKQVGLYEQALQYYNKVVRVIESDPDKYQDKTAPLYQSLGNLYHDLGAFEKAKQYNELAILNYSKQFGPKSFQVGNIYYNQALIAGDLEDQNSRVKYAHNALHIFMLEPEPDLSWIADCFEQISLAFMKSNPDSALYYAQKGRVLLDSAGIVDGIERASNTSYIAAALSKKGKHSLADSLMTLSVEMVRAVYGNKHILTANYLTNQANLMAAAGKYDRALALYDASLEAYGYTRGCRFDTLIYANQLLENLGKRCDMLTRVYWQTPSHAKRAQIDAGWAEVLQLLDHLRRRYQGTEAKLLFASHFKSIAESAIQWFVDKNGGKNPEIAWQFAEKARSLALLEALRSAGAWNTVVAADSLRALATTFAAEKKKWYDQYSAAESEKERSDCLLKFMDADQRQEQWLQVLERSDSAFYKAKYDNQVVSTTAVRSMLEPDQALLEFFVGKEHIFVYVIRRDTFMVKSLPLDFPLELWVKQMRLGLHGHYAPDSSQTTPLGYQASISLYAEYAERLYKRLLLPVQAWLPTKLIVVPDGLLGVLPFQVLLTATPSSMPDFKSYPYLMRGHQISYTYSATLLKEMRGKQHQDSPKYEMAAFAPFYPVGEADEPSQTQAGRQGFEPLPFSQLELEQIKKWMSGQYFLNSDAIVQTFKKVSGDSRFLHFAGHAVADSRVGEHSFLVFSKNKNGDQYEFLNVGHICQLELIADMVVLSACETSVGQLRHGEGIISLSRAFAYAGAKSVITSLWSVNNKSTANLMAFFYEALAAGQTKDQALYTAQQRFIENATARDCHPFFWAGFVAIGDMRAVK